MFLDSPGQVKVWSWICQWCVTANSAAVAPRTQEGDCIRIKCRKCLRISTAFVSERTLISDRRSSPRA